MTSNHTESILTEAGLIAARKLLQPDSPQLYGAKMHPADLHRLKRSIPPQSYGPHYGLTEFPGVHILVDYNQEEGIVVTYWSKEEFDKAAEELGRRRLESEIECTQRP